MGALQQALASLKSATGGSAPAYKSIGTALASNGTLGLPASHSAGDILIIACTGGNGLYATPSGWSVGASNASAPRIALFYKTDSGSETTVAMTSGGAAGQCVMLSYSGSSGLDVAGTVNNSTSTTTVATTSLTTLTANDVVISVFSEDGTNSITAPGSTNVRYSDIGTGRGLLVVDEVQAAAGATTTRTATWGATVNCASFAISFKP